jgi:nitroreductase
MHLSATSPPTARRAETCVPIHPLLDERWSPRSFDATAVISDAQLDALLEAARWAPSASNKQPRRYIVGRRGTTTFATIAGALMGFNAGWAPRASALIVGIAETHSADGEVHSWCDYDLGQAIAHLSVQAHAEGLHVHQMAGVEWHRIITAFDLAPSLKPVTVTAVGTVAPAGDLPDKLAARETAARTRAPLDQLVLRRE